MTRRPHPRKKPRKNPPRKNSSRKSSSGRSRPLRRAPAAQSSRKRPGELFDALVALQATLRAPGGCPWDREQTHHTLRTFLLEEAYEALDALDAGLLEGRLDEFCGELGDLLLQIIFHSLLAQEAGRFDISDVIERVHSKMVRRHPHVFGAVKARTSADVLKNWESLKAAERRAASAEAAPAASAEASPAEFAAEPSLLDAVPNHLPALMESLQMTRRAANIGFDWPNTEGIFEKLREETEELRRALAARAASAAADSASGAAVEEELGDLLFTVANLSRFLGFDPEIALRRANRKFASRFRWMERQAARDGARLARVPRGRMEALWEASKRRS
jgi:nucleoside triphosphate diphosphatase